MELDERIADVLQRHGPDSPNARARVERVPYLLAATARVENRLQERKPPAGNRAAR